MNAQDYKYLAENLDLKNLYGCDSSLVNIFLYRKQYNISWEIKDNIFYRQYNHGNEKGYAFPIPLKTAGDNYLTNALDYIIQQDNPSLCFMTREQKAAVDRCLSENFSKYKVDWKTDRSDTDYVYLQKNLAELHGDVLQKKKNHVSKFLRTYENQWKFKTYPEDNVLSDVLKVENQWFFERNGNEIQAFQEERQMIEEAVENAELMKIRAGVLYVQEIPVAMTIASQISGSVLDIHFEKVLSSYAGNGGYAAINQFFAKANPDYLYFNREEDLGIEGLRKAKLSYKPEILLDKFYGKILN